MGLSIPARPKTRKRLFQHDAFEATGQAVMNTPIKTLILPLVGFVATLASATASASAAGEQAFIDGFGGSWSGYATVIAHTVPLQVSCRIVGKPMTNRIRIEGSCRLLMVSIPIAADITYDPTSKRYNGTYIGSEVGPARVSGHRNGGVLNLAVTWPRMINGDDKGRMMIENSGNGGLRITSFDNVVVGGGEEWTSDAKLTITRSVAQR
jgi:hypothetical protein